MPVYNNLIPKDFQLIKVRVIFRVVAAMKKCLNCVMPRHYQKWARWELFSAKRIAVYLPKLFPC